MYVRLVRSFQSLGYSAEGVLGIGCLVDRLFDDLPSLGEEFAQQQRQERVRLTPHLGRLLERNSDLHMHAAPKTEWEGLLTIFLRRALAHDVVSCAESKAVWASTGDPSVFCCAAPTSGKSYLAGHLRRCGYTVRDSDDLALEKGVHPSQCTVDECIDYFERFYSKGWHADFVFTNRIEESMLQWALNKGFSYRAICCPTNPSFSSGLTGQRGELIAPDVINEWFSYYFFDVLPRYCTKFSFHVLDRERESNPCYLGDVLLRSTNIGRSVRDIIRRPEREWRSAYDAEVPSQTVTGS